MASANIVMKSKSGVDIHRVKSNIMSNIGGELVKESVCDFEDGKTVLLVYEKFYFRNGGYASLTIMLVQKSDIVTAEIIGCGGGSGVFNFSYGINSEFAHDAEKILLNMGFESVVRNL